MGMKHVKTWAERCEEHPDHNGIVTERMIQARMQEEIDELREALAELERLVTAWRIRPPGKSVAPLLLQAVAAEREACAQLCEGLPDLKYKWKTNFPSDCAAAIRARGEKE